MSRLLHSYINFLRRYAWVVMFIWLAAAIASAFFAMKFIEVTTVSFKPPKGTTVYEANRARAKHFPADKEGQQAQLSMFAKISSPDLFNATLTTPICKKNINETNIPSSIVDIPSVIEFVEALALKAIELDNEATVANYYLIDLAGAKDISAQLVSPDKTVLLMPILLPVQFAAKSARDFGTSIVTAQENIENEFLKSTALNLLVYDNDTEYVDCLVRQLSAGATGVPIMETAMISQSKSDLARMDAITIPIAFLIMALTVQSLRILILPGLSIGLTIAVSFALCYPIGLHIPIISAAPSLMMSLCIASCVDYNLFILSRFVQEVRAGHRGAAAVMNTMKTAGHTVFVSGTSITVSFIALCFFDLQLLQSFGIGCSMTMVFALLISLNLTPTILIQFFSFFEHAAYPKPLARCMPQWRIFEKFGYYLRAPGDDLDDGDEKHRSSSNHSRNNNNNGSGSPVPTLEAQEDFGHHNNSSPNSNVNNNTTSPNQTAPLINNNNTNASSSSSPVRAHPIRNRANSSQLENNNNYQNNNNNNNNNNTKQNLSDNQQESFSGNSTLRSLRNFFGGNNNKNNNNNYSDADFDPALNPVPSLPQLSNTVSSSQIFANDQKLIDKERNAQFGDKIGDSFFMRFQPILRFPGNVITIILLLGLIGFVGSYTLDLKVTDEMSSFLSRGSSQRKDFMMIKNTFGEGSVFPFEFVFILNNQSASSSILEEPHVFDEAHFVLNHLANVTNTPLKQFQGIFTVGGRMITFDQVQVCLAKIKNNNNNSNNNNNIVDDKKCDPNVESMLLANGSFVSPDRKAAIINFISNVDPTGNDGQHFYKLLLEAVKVRSTHDDVNDLSSPFDVLVCGVGPMSMASITSTYDEFPIILGVTCAAMLLMVGFTFKSIVVPLRCVISIAFTEAFVFGMTVLTYQYGIFDFLDAASVSKAGAVSWLSPIVASVVIAGCALDYDVLLLTSISEFITKEGVTTAEGTLLGLCATASTITSAGICMAIAFFGLVLTEMRLVNELGFMLSLAVLVDTFIVRSLLVPAIISVLGKYHWWPSNLESFAFSHIFGPADSISARASYLKRDSDAMFHNNNNNNNSNDGGNNHQYYGTHDSGLGGGGGNNNDYNHGNSKNVSYLNSSSMLDTGRVNKSAQYLEQQKQRLQHLFGGAE